MTLLDCPGCGAAPVLETEFGRHLYVCPNYAGRTTGATGRCVKHMATPTAYDLEDAGEYWNLSCEEKFGSGAVAERPTENQLLRT